MEFEKKFVNRDEKLREKTEEVIDKRTKAGLDGLVGGLQCVIINTEPGNQKAAVREFLRYTGLEFDEAFENADIRACILKREESADFMVASRKQIDSKFSRLNDYPKALHLPNTRLETFVFTTPDLKRYVGIQKSLGITFLTEDIIKADNFLFIQTQPSTYTGNSIGFIEWKGEPGRYSGFRNSRVLPWHYGKPDTGYQRNIGHLDHAATRVRAEDRDSAILEFMALTNYNFQFAIYVKSINSITNVARLSETDFAMVFTSGVTPYVSDEESGPTEKLIRNYGPRVHHLAFHTENIDETFQAVKDDGMGFLVELVGSPEEGLKQTFTEASPNTLLVNEYIYRYGDFDGFFTKSNVSILTEATGKQ
jgi:hypothetical protein